jgi:hypothetical protein
MRRFPWSILFALLLGVGLGLAYAWVITPRGVTDTGPSALRADFKDQYRSLVAASYAATGNLPRAQARLSILGDTNLIDALNAQAQRMHASAQTFERADQVVALASALGAEGSGAPVSTPTLEIIDAGNTFTPTSLPQLTGEPILEAETPQLIETQPAVFETLPAVSEPTSRPTRTSTPEPGEPFALAGQETLCDTNLPEGLLQVLVLNRSRRQLAGVEIVITWDGGEEQFFTGLKPELGNGYADYLMTPDTTYAVQLGRGSDAAQGITPPVCQNPDGENFIGGIKLTFQQP